jgi:hypothetical protein
MPMTTAAHDIASAYTAAAPQIRKDGRPGPVTAAHQQRTALVYATLCIVGLLPLLTRMSAGWQAAGLGLWFPGAGFLAVGGWAILLLPVTAGLFALALFVARAHSQGDDLDLVLYPGAQPGPRTLRIERLRPGARYTMAGAREGILGADESGAASVEIDLRGRTPLRIAIDG